MRRRRLTPYRDRILHYCAERDISVPRNFDIAQSSARYAFVEEVSGQLSLLPKSTFVKSEVISFLAAPENAVRVMRVVDFRSGRELVLGSDGKLSEIGRFDPAPPGEILYLAET